MNRLPEPGSRPRVWAIGISKLRDLFRDIADEYDTRADLRLVSRGYEDAVNEIAAAGKERPDILVAAGSNGTLSEGARGCAGRADHANRFRRDACAGAGAARRVVGRACHVW